MADVKPNSTHKDLKKDAGEAAIARLDRFRHASGGTPTAELRWRMQRTMQDYCAVFRTGEILTEGVKRIGDVWKASDDLRVTDRSLVWNSDLIETLEVRQSHRAGGGHRRGRPGAQGKPRGPRARGFRQARRQELDEAHLELDRRRQAQVGYRPVHDYTLSKDIDYIKPKARVY